MWWMIWGALTLASPALAPTADEVVSELSLRGVLPSGSYVESVGRGSSGAIAVGPVRVLLAVDGLWLEQLTDSQVDDVVRGFVGAFGRGVSCEVWAVDAWTGESKPLPAFLPASVPVPSRPWEAELPPPVNPVVVPAQIPGEGAGFLTGKHVYVSQGHGWTWSDTYSSWGTQRPNSWGVVEDFLNAEAVNQYLIPYLENAGATVFPVRESDLNEALVIVDNEDAAANPEVGKYEEVGPFETSTALGFGHFAPPYPSGINLFSAGTTRFAWTSPGAQTLARFTPNLPKSGFYTVSLTWAASANRTSSAKVVVRHGGGTTEFYVDQKRHGSTWVVLGRFHFEAGQNEDVGCVEVWADAPSEGEDRVISVDAVKFGGGRGIIQRGNGSGANNGPTSGRPRWEENCRYSAQFHGAPSSVYDASSTDGSDDVGARSRYAAWQHEAGEDAVYISWHTNAPSPGTGTSTYVYGPNEPNGEYTFTGTEGSDDLAKFVHDEVVLDIRADYDSGWDDLGRYSAWFGELNPSYNDEMPAALIEVGFHDTELECLKMQDPKFRALVSRAIYRGIVKFFAAKAGVPPVFLPDAPVKFSVQTLADGRTKLTWSAAEISPITGASPTDSYRVYRSLDGKAFDAGVGVLAGTELVLDDIPANQTVYFRVTAVNGGGESFPTPVLATRKHASGKRGALVVAGFERLDRNLLISQDLSTYGLSTVKRMLLDRINRFDYVVQHAKALELAGMPFDSGWLDSELVSQQLGTYSFVDWFVGRDSTGDEALSSAEQLLVQAYLSQGGRLLLSGSEIGWDLVEKGSAEEKLWFETWLHATYVSDDALSHQIRLKGTSITLDDGTQGTYDAAYPDVLAPVAGGGALVQYGDTEAAAGVWWANEEVHGVVLLGFPLETVVSDEARALLMSEVLAVLKVEAPVDDPVEPNPESVTEVEEVVTQPETVEQPEPETDVQTQPDTVLADVQPPKDVLPWDLEGRDMWVTTRDCKEVGGCSVQWTSGSEAGASGLTLLSLLLLLALRRRSDPTMRR